MKVRFAIAPGGAAFDGQRFVELVEQLEARGFDTLWLSDIPMGPSVDPVVGLGCNGITKFVLRPNSPPAAWGPELDFLTDTLFDLQT